MKRGMFFTVSIALLIAVIFFSVSLRTATSEIKESGGPEKFKALSLRSIGASVSEETLNEFVQTAGRRAVYYLDWNVRYSGKYSQDPARDLEDMLSLGRCRPVDMDRDGKPDISKKEFEKFASRCIGKSGTGECREFDINGDGEVDEKDSVCFEKTGASGDSFASLNQTIYEAAKERGLEFSLSTREFALQQTGPWDLKLSLTADVNIQDFEKTTGISRSVKLGTVVPIEGLEDPLVGVESAESYGKPGLRRAISPSAGIETRNITKKIDPDARGRGWAYGKTAGLGEAGTGDKAHILVVKEATEQVALIADNYAGVVAESAPVVVKKEAREVKSSGGCTAVCEYEIYEEVSGCLDCMRWSSGDCGLGSQIIGIGPCPSVSPPKILERTGKNAVSVPFLLGVSLGNAEAILFDSGVPSDSFSGEASGASAWDIEELRGAILCGRYGQNPDAPDFLQRLKGERYANSENGMESLLMPGLVNEPWGGSQWVTPVSMVDYLYYRDSKTPGLAVKGVPGCASPEECENNWPRVFALDDEHVKRYGLGGIVCGNMSGPC